MIHFSYRDFPLLKALDDGIDRCLEMGSPFLYVMGMMATVRGEFAGVIAVLSLLRVLTRRCFEKNVRVIVVPGGAADETVPMLDTLLKESALEIGKPEMYKTERDLVYLGRAYSAELVNLIEVEKPGCTANVGVIGGLDMIAWEPVHRNDSLLVGGTHRLVQCGCVAVAADYALICDEVYAACAAASGNKDLISTALSGDLAKYVL
ncbi:MAG: DUF6754 domain-containing protein [Candidatus Bathyarchaeia archaeon]